MKLSNIRIAAPVCSVEEAQAVIAAGADEIYFGVMYDDWWEKYGEADLMSRRQGRASHLRTPGELAEIAALAHAAKRTAVLAVNSRYTRDQEKMVLDLVQQWEEAGGDAVMVSDLGILLALNQRHSPLKKHLSLLTGVYNAAAVHFYAELGVTRVVLPRELTIEEMRTLVSQGPPKMEYEVLVLNQKCQFIDGMCNFYHHLRQPAVDSSDFDNEKRPAGTYPEVLSYDPGYEGHGCYIPWKTSTGEVLHLQRDDWNTPYCAACLLPYLYRAGIHCYKIAGRGYPQDIVVRAVSFFRQVVETWRSGSSVETDNVKEKEAEIRQIYTQTFKNKCRRHCYYKIATKNLPATGRSSWEPQSYTKKRRDFNV